MRLLATIGGLGVCASSLACSLPKGSDYSAFFDGVLATARIMWWLVLVCGAGSLWLTRRRGWRSMAHVFAPLILLHPVYWLPADSGDCGTVLQTMSAVFLLVALSALAVQAMTVRRGKGRSPV